LRSSWSDLRRDLASIIAAMKSPPDALPLAVYSSDQVRALDKMAIETFGIPGIELMARAAEAAFAALLERWPKTRALLVFCGAGNNAGDGYLVARLAHSRGIDARVVAVGDPRRLRGDAATAWSQCTAAGVTVLAWPELPGGSFAPDIVIDALLGTGLDRDLDRTYAAAVACINESSRAPVLALDVPSGIDADTGRVRGAAVHAALTITFVGLKQGLFLAAHPIIAGRSVSRVSGFPRRRRTCARS
jgi:NAD(P)H-hydrate epimerase